MSAVEPGGFSEPDLSRPSRAHDLLVHIAVTLSVSLALVWRILDRRRSFYVPGKVLLTANNSEAIRDVVESLPRTLHRRSHHHGVAFSDETDQHPPLVTAVLLVPPGCERAGERWCRYRARVLRDESNRLYEVARPRRVFLAQASAAPGDDRVAFTPVHDEYLGLLGLPASTRDGFSFVATLDTAFDPAWLPPEVAKRVIVRPSALGVDAHGAVTAAIIAACSPQAKVVCYPVSDGRWGDETEVISALGQLLLTPFVDVINMSFSIPTRGPQQGLTFGLWARRHRDRGTVLLAAVGNCEFDCDGIFFPARDPHCVAIGSVDRQRSVSRFSRRATTETQPALLLLAPGGQRGEGAADQCPVSVGASTQLGTSVACAYASGVLAAFAVDQRIAAASSNTAPMGAAALDQALSVLQQAPVHESQVYGRGILHYVGMAQPPAETSDPSSVRW